MTIETLVQIDRLVQILETPVFTFMRLHLLQPAQYPALLRFDSVRLNFLFAPRLSFEYVLLFVDFVARARRFQSTTDGFQLRPDQDLFSAMQPLSQDIDPEQSRFQEPFK